MPEMQCAPRKARWLQPDHLFFLLAQVLLALRNHYRQGWVLAPHAFQPIWLWNHGLCGLSRPTLLDAGFPDVTVHALYPSWLRLLALSHSAGDCYCWRRQALFLQSQECLKQATRDNTFSASLYFHCHLVYINVHAGICHCTCIYRGNYHSRLLLLGMAHLQDLFVQ